ncbi:hypothetical protein AAY473_003422 [Plecturocebus cupreus]
MDGCSSRDYSNSLEPHSSSSTDVGFEPSDLPVLWTLYPRGTQHLAWLMAFGPPLGAFDGLQSTLVKPCHGGLRPVASPSREVSAGSGGCPWCRPTSGPEGPTQPLRIRTAPRLRGSLQTSRASESPGHQAPWIAGGVICGWRQGTGKRKAIQTSGPFQDCSLTLGRREAEGGLCALRRPKRGKDLSDPSSRHSFTHSLCAKAPFSALLRQELPPGFGCCDNSVELTDVAVASRESDTKLARLLICYGKLKQHSPADTALMGRLRHKNSRLAHGCLVTTVGDELAGLPTEAPPGMARHPGPAGTMQSDVYIAAGLLGLQPLSHGWIGGVTKYANEKITDRGSESFQNTPALEADSEQTPLDPGGVDDANAVQDGVGQLGAHEPTRLGERIEADGRQKLGTTQAGRQWDGGTDAPFSASQSRLRKNKAMERLATPGPGLSYYFGRQRQVDHLRPGVQDQPGQHGETPSLPKIEELARRAIQEAEAENCLNPGGGGCSEPTLRATALQPGQQSEILSQKTNKTLL